MRYLHKFFCFDPYYVNIDPCTGSAPEGASVWPGTQGTGRKAEKENA